MAAATLALALGAAVDAEATAHKSISGSVAGNADVPLPPDLISGTVFYKAVRFFRCAPCRDDMAVVSWPYASLFVVHCDMSRQQM